MLWLRAAVRREVRPFGFGTPVGAHRTVAVNENGTAVQLASRPAAMQTYDSL